MENKIESLEDFFNESLAGELEHIEVNRCEYEQSNIETAIDNFIESEYVGCGVFDSEEEDEIRELVAKNGMKILLDKEIVYPVTYTDSLDFNKTLFVNTPNEIKSHNYTFDYEYDEIVCDMSQYQIDRAKQRCGIRFSGKDMVFDSGMPDVYFVVNENYFD